MRRLASTIRGPGFLLAATVVAAMVAVAVAAPADATVFVAAGALGLGALAALVIQRARGAGADRPPLDGLPGAVVRVDHKGRVQALNGRAGALLPELRVGHVLCDRVTAEGDRPLADVLRDGDAGELEVLAGTRRLRVSIGPVREGHGSRIVQFTDITAYRAMSDHVARCEEEYRSLFFGHPDATFILDLDGRFVEANGRATELAGYALDDMIGVHWQALVPVSDQVHVESNFRAAAGGESREFNASFRSADGRRIDLVVTNIPMYVGAGVVGVFGIARDITARKRLEEERHLLGAAIDQLDDAILITEAEPLDEPGPRIVYAGGGIMRATGYAPPELIGETPRLLQGPDTDPGARARMRRALAAGQPIREVVLNYRKDGTPFWNEIDMVPVPPVGEGGRAHFAAVQRDVTERKRHELALQQSRAQLRRLNSALEGVREEERSRIARDLHDDLGQTLTALRLDLGWLATELPDDGAPGRRRLDEAQTLVDNAIDQVREIAANLRPGILDDLGFEAAGEWLVDRIGRRYELDARWEVEESGRASGDTATALFRILQECLTNVARHAGATRVRAHYAEEGDTAHLQVEDDGVGGIDDDADTAGMGLVGIRERAALLGGGVRVDSPPGEGTRVSVWLPLGREQ